MFPQSFTFVDSPNTLLSIKVLMKPYNRCRIAQHSQNSDILTLLCCFFVLLCLLNSLFTPDLFPAPLLKHAIIVQSKQPEDCHNTTLLYQSIFKKMSHNYTHWRAHRRQKFNALVTVKIYICNNLQIISNSIIRLSI